MSNLINRTTPNGATNTARGLTKHSAGGTVKAMSDSTSTKRKKPAYPIKPTHFAVRTYFHRWALAHDYTRILVDYEMPNRPKNKEHWPKVDFLCQHREGDYLLAVCKADLGSGYYSPRKDDGGISKKTVEACTQAWKYYDMSVKSFPAGIFDVALVLPKGEAFPQELQHIRDQGLGVIELDLPDRMVGTAYLSSPVAGETRQIEIVKYDRNWGVE